MIALRLGAVCCAQRLGWTTVHCTRARIDARRGGHPRRDYGDIGIKFPATMWRGVDIEASSLF